MEEPIITLRNVTKEYKLYSSNKSRLTEALSPFHKHLHKRFIALNNITLDIYKGEILGILGRNGSGKSTMLKILAGVLQPTSGQVNVVGKMSPLLELSSGLDQNRTGLENIEFMLRIMGHDMKEIPELAEQITSFAEIGDHIDQPLRTYSSGMKARLAFSINTVISPDILILDEILSVGDAQFKRKSYARMEELMSGGTTVLFVSHSAQSVARLCSRAILLDQGNLLCSGSTKQVSADYESILWAKGDKRQRLQSKIRQKFLEKPILYSSSSDIGTIAEDGEQQTPQKSVDQFVSGFESKAKRKVIKRNGQINSFGIYKKHKIVNQLVGHEGYDIALTFTMDEPVPSLRVSISVSNLEGVCIFTGRYPENVFDDFRAESGVEYRYEQPFKNILAAGTYVMTIKFYSVDNDGNTSKLLEYHDWYMFRVQIDSGYQRQGLVSLPDLAAISEVESSE